MDIFWNYTLYSIYIIQKYQETFLIDDHYKFQGICYSNVKLQWNFDIMKGLAKYMYVCYNKVCCMKVLFSIVYRYWGHRNRLLNQGSTALTTFLPMVNK